jgi:acyl dehydratase
MKRAALERPGLLHRRWNTPRCEGLASGLVLCSAIRRLLARMWVVPSDAFYRQDASGPNTGLWRVQFDKPTYGA